MVDDGASKCYRCQHCLAICPHGAISILGRKPEASLALQGNLPTPLAMEALIRGRRSTRLYKEENLPREQIQEMLEIAAAAPTGRNSRCVRWVAIDEREKLAVFREKLLNGIDEKAAREELPPGREGFANFPKAWRESRNDILFRGAPHFLVACVEKDAATPQVDAVIALSYFELLAHTRGVATVWDGLAYWAMTELVPEAREWLGIPENQLIGYCMAFGLPRIPFARTAQHTPAPIRWV